MSFRKIFVGAVLSVTLVTALAVPARAQGKTATVNGYVDINRN